MPDNREQHEAPDLATAIAHLADTLAEAEDLMAEFAREKFTEARRLSREMRESGELTPAVPRLHSEG
jgi:hypothetical protein